MARGLLCCSQIRYERSILSRLKFRARPHGLFPNIKPSIGGVDQPNRQHQQSGRQAIESCVKAAQEQRLPQYGDDGRVQAE